ncbi:MAG: hypothetical protein GX220_03175 [Treponema sp.]|nr:hypothetical protein [Treponema sp.]
MEDNKTLQNDKEIKQEASEKNANSTTVEKKKKSVVKIIFILVFVIVLKIIFLLVLNFIFKLDNSRKVFEDYKNSLPNYNKSPVLVFKEVNFYKYLIRGSEKEMQIFLVSGKADFGFDLSCAKIDTNKTNLLSRTIYIDYELKTHFPIFVDVQISEYDVQCVKSFYAQIISEEEIEKAAKTVGVIGGGTASLFGGIVGSKFAMSPVKKIISGSVVGVTSGIAVGTGSYLMTRNFLQNFNDSGNIATEREKIIDESKILIALELLESSENVLKKDDLIQWEQNIITNYKADIIDTMKRFFIPFGWKNIELNFIKTSEGGNYEN